MMATIEIGDIIRATRRFDFKMSQSELAEKAGVSRNEISQIERRAGNPRLTTIIKILRALDLKLVIQLAEKQTEAE